MITPFKAGNRITQKYKNNPAYYAQFGLKGHEGIDLVPLSGSWDIFCIEGGEIIRDQDDPRGGAYGNNVVVWNKANKRAWYYCHMDSNQVSSKQTIRRGDKIGVMGATGNTKGAHLHLNLCETDENGVRLNKDNGYLGFIDPLPLLEELNKEPVIISPPVSNIDYKAIFDKTGDQLPDRALKDDSLFQTDKLYKDNNIPYVTLTADSVNHFMSEFRKFRDIANTPAVTPPTAPQTGDNFEAVVDTISTIKPDLAPYPAVEFDVFDWLWRKISQIWKK